MNPIPRPLLIFGWAIEYDRLRQWIRENGITCRSCGQENHTECDPTSLTWSLDLFDIGVYNPFRIISSAPSAETPVESCQYFLGIEQDEFTLGPQFTHELMDAFNDREDVYGDHERRQRLRNISGELRADDDRPSFYVGLSWGT